MYANEEFDTVTTCGVNRITVFVVIVASDSIAEAGSVPTNESTYRSDQSPLDRAYLYSWDIKVLLASIRDGEEAVYETITSPKTRCLVPSN